MGRKIKRNAQLFFSFLKDCVSLNTPQAIIFDILLISLILSFVSTDSLSNFPIKCVFKTLILPLVFNGNCPTSGVLEGCECPACGLTHAYSSVMHGDFEKALDYNILIIPVLIIVSILLIYNSIKIIKSSK